MLKKDYLDKAYEGKVKMPYPMTPGYWVDDSPTYENVVRVRMTCGGGVGGAQWFEYMVGVALEDIADAKFFIFKDLNGKDVMINTSYIVEAKPFKIAKAVYHSDNHNFTKGNYVVRYLLDPNATAELVSEY